MIPSFLLVVLPLLASKTSGNNFQYSYYTTPRPQYIAQGAPYRTPPGFNKPPEFPPPPYYIKTRVPYPRNPPKVQYHPAPPVAWHQRPPHLGSPRPPINYYKPVGDLFSPPFDDANENEFKPLLAPVVKPVIISTTIKPVVVEEIRKEEQQVYAVYEESNDDSQPTASPKPNPAPAPAQLFHVGPRPTNVPQRTAAELVALVESAKTQFLENATKVNGKYDSKLILKFADFLKKQYGQDGAQETMEGNTRKVFEQLYYYPPPFVYNPLSMLMWKLLFGHNSQLLLADPPPLPVMYHGLAGTEYVPVYPKGFGIYGVSSADNVRSGQSFGTSYKIEDKC